VSSLLERPARKPVEGPGWLATYGDLVTLLMAFFVMLFAISSVEADRFEAFVSGLGMFDNPAAMGTPEVAPIGDPISPPVPLPVPAPVPPAIAPVVVEGADLRDVGRRVVAAVAAAGHAGTVEVQPEPRGLALVIGTDDVLFATGSTRVSARGREIVAAIAPVLNDVGNRVLAEGHADTTPLRRGGYTNWNLSTDRAVAVVNLLTDDHGLPAARLIASGFGEHDPRDTDDSPEGRARNRRVELVVVG
jgi:chemotaxis protein MotB